MTTDERLEEIAAEIDVIRAAIFDINSQILDRDVSEELFALVEYWDDLDLERENILENR